MTETREVDCKECGQTKTEPADVALENAVPNDVCTRCWMRREAEELG